jgi:hypothetical protein
MPFESTTDRFSNQPFRKATLEQVVSESNVVTTVEKLVLKQMTGKLRSLIII